MTPTRAGADTLERARQLRGALEQLAAALASGDEAAVLASEPALVAALSIGGSTDAAASDDRAAAAAELGAARAALARCRALGAANAELTGVTLDVLGRTGAYSRHGAGQPRGPRGITLHARV